MWLHQRMFLMVSTYTEDSTVLLETIGIEFAFYVNRQIGHSHLLTWLLDCFQVCKYNQSQQNRNTSSCAVWVVNMKTALIGNSVLSAVLLWVLHVLAVGLRMSPNSNHSVNADFSYLHTLRLLTLSDLQIHFETKAADDYWNHCGQRWNCSWWAISS